MLLNQTGSWDILGALNYKYFKNSKRGRTKRSQLIYHMVPLLYKEYKLHLYIRPTGLNVYGNQKYRLEKKSKCVFFSFDCADKVVLTNNLRCKTTDDFTRRVCTTRLNQNAGNI